jgi:hypothetical protein
MQANGLQFCGTGCVQLTMHTPEKPPKVPQQVAALVPTVFMHTWPLAQSDVELQTVVPEVGQHWCTQCLFPPVVLMQMHVFRVCLQRLQQPAPRRGHIGAASATVALPNTPATPKALAAANLSARLLEMVRLARPLARSSKNCSPIISPPFWCYSSNKGSVLLTLRERKGLGGQGPRECRGLGSFFCQISLKMGHLTHINEPLDQCTGHQSVRILTCANADGAPNSRS